MEYTEKEANYYHDIGGLFLFLALTSFASALLGNNYQLIGGMAMLGFIVYAIGVYMRKNLFAKRN